MSQAELHFLRGRLQGGKINKAKKGELRSPLPVGFVYDEEGKTVPDRDAEVRHAVTMLFEKFREKGSAFGVVHAFAKEGIQFPKRAYGGAWDGKLIWGRLTESRARLALKNPAYAGAYVYGRYQSTKDIAPDGTFLTRVVETPLASWTVCIKDHHEGYLSWERFEENKELLERNRTNGQILQGPAREGHALLQGLLICRGCGRRITIRYMGNGGIYPVYDCNWQRREGLSSTSCITIRCDLLDKPVVSRLLEVVEPKQIEIALEAFEELERREETVDQQWRMKLERAAYEVDLAQRRYENVDPANRLVAATLERLWNDALASAEEIKKACDAHRASKHMAITDERKKDLLSLAQDLPSLWAAPTTQDRDRKRILRLLIKDITVEKLEPKKCVLHLRWQGGACEDIPVSSPPSYVDQIRYPAAVVDQVRALANHLTDRQTAAHLNEAGLMSAKGKSFTSSIVRCIRYAYRIPAPVLKLPGELTVDQVAEKFAVSPNVVYYWIEHHMVSARRPDGMHYYYIALDPEKEKVLADLVAQSVKMHRKVNGSLNHAAGGAV
jgi:hypothetical protein